MSTADLPRLSSNDSSPRHTVGDKNHARPTGRDDLSAETGPPARMNEVPREENAPLWVLLPAIQELFNSAIPGSSVSQSVSMISWLKFWSDRNRCISALSNLSKTDFITIFLDTKRGAVGTDAHELSLSDFCICLIAVADRLSMISIPSSPGRSAASRTPSSELLSVMSGFTSSLILAHEPKLLPLPSTPSSAPTPVADSVSPSHSLFSSGLVVESADRSVAPLGTPEHKSGAPDISSQVLQLLHQFYEFYSRGASRLSHDNYVQCLMELQALHAGSAAIGDATQIFFKFAATPDRGMTQEQFVDSFVHLAHETAPESPLHSSLHALVVLGMGAHFSRLQERHRLQEVLDSDIIGELLRETQPFCEAAFRTCSGGKSILNIAQVNRWIVTAKIQPNPSQTDVIRVFRDVLRLQAVRGSSSVGLDSLGFQSFLLQLALLPIQASQLTASTARSSFMSFLKVIGWNVLDGSVNARIGSSPLAHPHANLAASDGSREVQAIVASPASSPLALSASISNQEGRKTSLVDSVVNSSGAPPVSNPKSPPIPTGIAIALAKSATNSASAGVGNSVLNQLADLDQPSAFTELQRIYTDKQILVVQRKKELQAELDAWSAAEYEAAEVKHKEQAIFRPTPALQDRERALQVLLSNASKTNPEELRRQQQIVEAFASKERQAWRFRCDVYSSTVRSRVKMAVDVKKNRLADTLRSMQIQLEVNMKKDFEALSKRFANKAIFLRSSGPIHHVTDKFNAQPQPNTQQPASSASRVSVASYKPSVAFRSQSAPRKQASSTGSNHEFDGQEEHSKHMNGVPRERPQSSMPTMSRRKSVLQEMEEAYLKAASRFASFAFWISLHPRFNLSCSPWLRTEPRKAPLPSEARGRQVFSNASQNSGRRSASALSDASDNKIKDKAAAWGGSSSNTSNGQSRLNHLSDDDEAPATDRSEQGRQERCQPIISSTLFILTQIFNVVSDCERACSRDLQGPSLGYSRAQAC